MHLRLSTVRLRAYQNEPHFLQASRDRIRDDLFVHYPEITFTATAKSNQVYNSTDFHYFGI